MLLKIEVTIESDGGQAALVATAVNPLPSKPELTLRGEAEKSAQRTQAAAFARRQDTLSAYMERVAAGKVEGGSFQDGMDQG